MFATRYRASVLPFVFFISHGGMAAGETFGIPGDFTTIQECISFAVSGVDECLVAPGSYDENINFLGKAITVRSSGGAGVTTITGAGLNDSVVKCISGEGLDTILDGFTVTGGDASNGGGMFNAGSSPTVTNCTFNGNSAALLGGGMTNLGSSSPAVTNCTFSGNSALFGGGMVNTLSSSPTVTNCTFNGNSASVAAGGGMYNFESSPTVTNCTFSGNTSDGGGGMSNTGGSPTVTNCTFSGNSAVGGGGMLNTLSSSPTVTNCVLWGNSPDEVFDDGSSTTVTTYSDISGGFAGEGNINADPHFVDADNGDFRLTADSPCIDAGDPDFVPDPGETDLEGHARVLCDHVDMGAYDFGIGDYDCDHVVDLFDFEQWLACCTGPDGGPIGSGCEAFDSDADGDVDWFDFAAIQLVFTK